MQIVVSLLLVVCILAACVVTFVEIRPKPVARWRLLVGPLLALLPTLVLLRLPPPELFDPQVWMLALVFGVLGIARGAMIDLLVDHAQRQVLMRRAPEAFWIVVCAAFLVIGEIGADPIGRLDSRFAQTVELFLVVLTSFLVGRNVALLVRSRDVPHHDL